MGAKYRKIDIHCFPRGSDRRLEKHLKKMDENGVEKAVVHGMAEYIIEECDGVRPEDHNEWVLEVVKAHPDRFFGSVKLDLNKPVQECVALAERFWSKGFIGVKLYTQMGGDPSDDKFESLWEKLEKMGMIVFADSGPLLVSKLDPSIRLETYLSLPYRFEVPVRRHPNLKFDFVHFGGGITCLQAVRLMMVLGNVYSDCSPGDGRWPFVNDMPGLKQMPKDRFLFATNTCVFPYEEDEKLYCEKLPALCGHTEEQLKDFFYNNAAKMLGVV